MSEGAMGLCPLYRREEGRSARSEGARVGRRKRCFVCNR